MLLALVAPLMPASDTQRGKLSLADFSQTGQTTFLVQNAILVAHYEVGKGRSRANSAYAAILAGGTSFLDLDRDRLATES